MVTNNHPGAINFQGVCVFSKSHYRKLTVACGLIAWCVSSNTVCAQSVPSTATPLVDAAISNAEVARLDKQVYLSPPGLLTGSAHEPGQATLPRLAASLTSMKWLGRDADDSLSLAVEQDHWVVKWKQHPPGSSTIVLSFDSWPQLMSEVTAVEASGDGSIYLPACMATTVGEKIRFEPQTFKNTVGYWVGKHDVAHWPLVVSRPGSYNVAVLQGCGKDQGGSRARIKLSDKFEGQSLEDQSLAVQSLEFEVLETGHFQNFQWRHLGVLQVAQAGPHTLSIEPIEIKRDALVDIRAIHLIPLP